MRAPPSSNNGFTLAELLIALAILAVIAAFTIPKILASQQGQKNKAIVKEAAATVSGAYQAYKLANPTRTPTAISSATLTPYLNYVSANTVSDIDNTEGFAEYTCTAVDPCYRLHNGAWLVPLDTNFCGTASTTYIAFLVDPDGVYSNLTTGPSKSIRLNLYYKGRITDSSNQGGSDDACISNTTASNGWGGDAASTWFNWN